MKENIMLNQESSNFVWAGAIISVISLICLAIADILDPVSALSQAPITQLIEASMMGVFYLGLILIVTGLYEQRYPETIPR